MKSLIKRHKGLSIVVGLSLILLIVIFAILARMLFSSGSEYGDRLNNIVAVDSKTTDKIISETKELDEVDDITINIKGNYWTISIWIKWCFGIYINNIF